MTRDEHNKKWWVLFSIGIGSFMAALDGSVVNTILPVIRADFNSEVSSVQWIVTIYLLVMGGLLLTFGRLGDLHGHKKVYIWGFGIFAVSSVLCGMGWSTSSLVLFRGLQAIGGAMLASNAPAIITGNFPKELRGRAFGLASTLTYIGLTVGPSLGGWLAQSFGWRMVFFINLPVGLVALTLSLLLIPSDAPTRAGRTFDLPGAALFMAGLTALMLGLNKGASWGWGSPAVLGLLVSSLLILYIFIRVELRTPEPMLDLSLFKIRMFSTSVANAVLNYICIFSIMFLMPFFLIQGRGLDPAQAGLLLTSQPIIMAIAAPISGALSDKIGSRLPGMLGMGLLAIGLFLLSTITPTTPWWAIALPLALAGLGTGTFISPNTSALMSSAPLTRQGIASGVQAAARNFGMVLGIGLAGAILTTQMSIGTPDGLFRGVSLGFLTAGFVALLGVFLSATKEK